jgi:hypothetical protein
MRTALFFGILSTYTFFACGGSKTPANGPDVHPSGPPTPEEAEAATHPCGDADKTQQHDLNAKGATEAFVPCATGGNKHDYSGLVKIETVDNGVHIIIDARDDEVTILGPDVKSRDAVIVYPKADKKVAIEVPLMHTKTGYHGDKIVLWDDLDKLHDEGTKIDIAIYDHDKGTGSHQQMHVSVTISAGKSCEKAQDENPQVVSFDKKGGGKDLTRDQLGAPIKASNVAVACGLPDSTHAKICALVKGGRALGVSVGVDPKNNKVAACIDRKVRSLSYPSSDQPDTLTFEY